MPFTKGVVPGSGKLFKIMKSYYELFFLSLLVEMDDSPNHNSTPTNLINTRIYIIYIHIIYIYIYMTHFGEKPKSP